MSTHTQELAGIRERHENWRQHFGDEALQVTWVRSDIASLLAIVDRQAGEIAEMRAIATEAVAGMDFSIQAMLPASITKARDLQIALKERLNRTGNT